MIDVFFINKINNSLEAFGFALHGLEKTNKGYSIEFSKGTLVFNLDNKDLELLYKDVRGIIRDTPLRR